MALGCFPGLHKPLSLDVTAKLHWQYPKLWAPGMVKGDEQSLDLGARVCERLSSALEPGVEGALNCSIY